MENSKRALLLEQILEDFGFKSATRSWKFKEDGHAKVASIHAKDIYEVIKVLDWDELQNASESETVGSEGDTELPDEEEE